jgi:hypothetical protein
LLVFDNDGSPRGVFSQERINDPRGPAYDKDEGLLFVNSGSDHVLALDAEGTVVRDSGLISGLNPGGSKFTPGGRLFVGLRTARSILAIATSLDQAGNDYCLEELYLTRRFCI